MGADMNLFQADEISAQGHLIGGNAASADSGSLGVFPEELWEAILNHLSDSKDIKNVLLAFPVLDKSFHNKKSDWLFGLVLPHLMTKHLSMKTLKNIGVDWKWAQSKDLLNLRLVSKRWKNTVDGALQNEANQCPALTSAGHTSQTIENHFNFLSMSEYHLGMTIFQNAEQVDKFMEDMLDHQGNPFPGKSVWIQPLNALAINSDALIKKCGDLFEKFGKHVEVLDMAFYDGGSRCHLKMCNNILKCLSNLPNLRSLTFNGKFQGQSGDGEIRTDVRTTKLFEKSESQKMYPKLAKLETFVWKVVLMNSRKESAWVSGMIKAYGKGDKLRKLDLQENLYWSSVKSSSLINLTELTLFFNDGFEPNLVKLEKLLRSLPSSGQKLKKLGLKAMNPWTTQVKINLCELISILAKFKIESLALEDLRLEENPEIENDSEMEMMCPAETITSLFVGDRLELSYEFLGLLPNLRFLTVHQNKKVRQDTCIELGEEDDDEETFSGILRQSILKASVPELDIPDLTVIWEKLPKLEMIRGSAEVFLIAGEDDEYPPGFNLGLQYVRECGNRVFNGWTPEWDPMNELLFIDEEDDNDEDENDEN